MLNKVLRMRLSVKIEHSHFILKLFQRNSFGEVFFLEERKIWKKKSNFENFESALYSTSGSMPLNPVPNLYYLQISVQNMSTFQPSIMIDWLWIDQSYIRSLIQIATLQYQYGSTDLLQDILLLRDNVLHVQKHVCYTRFQHYKWISIKFCGAEY